MQCKLLHLQTMDLPLTPRLDLAACKKRLDHVLKEQDNVPYWLAVDKFLRAKLSKAELDEVAARLLGCADA